jgi:polyhydroxybutyrate depolymerase
MKRLFTHLFFLLLLGVSAKVRSQVTLEDSFMVNGLMRNYFLYVPAINSPQESVPLILNLHGYGSNKLEQLFYGDFRAIADTANFIVAVPNGSMDLTGILSWNTFGIGTVDDVNFISQLIDRINTSYSIDQNRIYSTGMSNGGFMSYELACQLSSRIAAVASVTGSMLT